MGLKIKMSMEDNINEIYRMRQEFSNHNDLTAQIRQLAKKLEILQNKFDSLTAERDTYKKLIIKQKRLIEVQENLINHYESKLKSLMNVTGENKS